MRRLTLLVLAFICAGCGGGDGSSLTGPSSTIPNVTGNYLGNTTMTFPELSRSVTCPTSTSVTQSGNTVSIAPLTLAGTCGNMSIPVGQATIDATGSFPNESGTFSDPSCGSYNYTASGGFFGRDLRLSINATSRTCYNLNMTITMTH